MIIIKAKLRVEIREYHLTRGLLIWLSAAFVVSLCLAAGFLKKYPAGCRGEFIVWVFNNYNVILVLFPLLLLAATSGGQTQALRYPLLIRYRSRNEFFLLKMTVRTGFALLCLLGLAGMLVFAGRGMPAETAHNFILSEDFGGIAARQCLNIFCFWSALLLLHEILELVVGNTTLDLAVTTFVPLGNYMLAKMAALRVLEWTPWGKISYKAEEIVGAPIEMVEKIGRYHFYWQYWLVLLSVMLYIAARLNGRKDFVFEKNYELQ